MLSRIGLLAFALCLQLIGLEPAAAQQADDAYEAALDRSLTAHAAGDFEAAEQAMRQAHALAPSARTLRGLGVILYAEGRYLEAVEPLESALLSQERPLDGALRASVEELLTRVFQRLGRLSLRVEPAGSVLSIDGREPALRPGNEVLLSPGEHQVHVEAEGYEPYTLTLRTTPGSRDSLHVALSRAKPAPLSAASAAHAEPASSARTSAPRSATPQRIWRPLLRNSLLGASAAVALAGGATWLVGYLHYQKLYDSCDSQGGCTDSEARARFNEEHIHPLTVSGLTLFATGAAALAVVGGIELWHQRRERQNAKLTWSPRGLSVSGQF